MSIYDWYEIRTDYVEIKFNQMLDAASISNNKFTVVKTQNATPYAVTSPFRTIDTTRDYYSTSRLIRLWWNVDLESNTDYTITIAGLQDIESATPATDTITFSTGTVSSDADDVTDEIPTKAPVDVEDYSIKTISSLIASSTTFTDADSLTITKTIPSSSISYYLKTTENEGRIEIWFNQAPAANFINSDYFTVQRKKVSRSTARWEPVAARITADTSKAIVFAYLPSLDATPVYAYEVDKDDGHEYFEASYKYRVVISKEVGL